MNAVKVDIVEIIDESYPGFVRCELTDAWGKEWLFEEKLPVVSDLVLESQQALPQAGWIACDVVRRWNYEGRDLVAINTEEPWHVAAKDGTTEFELLAEQLIVLEP